MTPIATFNDRFLQIADMLQSLPAAIIWVTTPEPGGRTPLEAGLEDPELMWESFMATRGEQGGNG